MRARLLAIRNSYTRFVQARNFENSGRPPRCDPHMNELPIPCIPWEPWYKEKQSNYNKILFFGICWWLFSAGMLYYTGAMYLNWKAPANPSPPSDMVEECDDEDE